jgi:hypothetical protein
MATTALERARLKRFGPIPDDGGHILTIACPGCQEKFKPGEFGVLLAIGPGSDPEARARALAGRPYNAVALPAHWACVTGDETTDDDDDETTKNERGGHGERID